MFTNNAQKIIDLAKDYSFSNNHTKLDLPAVVTVMKSDTQASLLLSECLSLKVEELRAEAPTLDKLKKCSRKLPLSSTLRSALVLIQA